MEDFEYSVEICDRDWDCFFAECEECNLLPPSLARVDDSGMSDMDDVGSILTRRAQRVDPAACSSLTERPVDGPPDCEGSPIEHFLSERGVGGLESVLSGSEEDIHLQSVNLFIEGLKGLTEDKLPEPEKNRGEEERWGDHGHTASRNTLPKNVPELNRLPAKGERPVGNKHEEPAGTMRITNTVRKDVCDTKTPIEPAPAERETPTSERGKVLIAGSMSGVEQWNGSQCETFTRKAGLEKSVSDPNRNPDVKWKENQTPSQSASPAWSPASLKKRRRRKRRPSDGGQVSAKQSDTDEERHSSPLCLRSSDDAASLCLNEPPKNVTGSKRRTAAGSVETTNNGSVTTPRQSDRINVRATGSSTDEGTHSGECDSSSVSVPGKPGQIKESQSNDAEVAAVQLNSLQPNGKGHPAEVESSSPTCTPAVDSRQNNRLSTAKSAVAAEAGNSGEDEHTLRHTQAEPQQQLEIHIHNTDQDGPLLKASVTPHLCPADPQNLKSREHLLLLEEVYSPLNDRSCEVTSQKETGRSLTSQKTQVQPPGCQVKVKLSKSSHEDFLTSASDITHVSSACSLESIMSLSHDNATDLSASFSSLLSDGKSISDHEEGGQQCDVMGAAEENIISQPEKSRNSVFAISSFWSEMEKLTINDILGLRMTSRASPPGCLPPLEESEEGDMLDVPLYPGCEDSSYQEISSPKNVTWESEPVLLNHVTEAPPAVFPMTPYRGLRNISKNVSVHNLRALESDSPAFDRAVERVEFSSDTVSNQGEGVTSPAPSLTDSYSFSLTDIFQHLFSGKQSPPKQTTLENPMYTSGSSVSESYDHFFSEFDTDSFFYPLMTAEDEEVPIFSCSRSATRDLQYPEAYDYFFKSSSSDESSDEEDEARPVRVVTRFSHEASSSQLSTDIYEDFYTDQEDFFGNTTFSFRNVNFPASTLQTQSSNSASLVPVREHRTSYPRGPHHLTLLGNENVMCPDPLLRHLDDRISRQLVQRPFTHEDLQTVVSNPRLDTPFLPLKQSDMCMVCIAFASWVLKTANPQVGDAWKAVLLANVSALSAIRYLRKYVRVEAAAGETTVPES